MRRGVVVLGYRGPCSGAVNRWRARIGVRTVRVASDAVLVCSGAHGEAELLAAEATRLGVDPVLEATATSTWANVACTLPLVEGCDEIAFASDRLHVARAVRYLGEQRPDLVDRAVAPDLGRWFDGWWIRLAAAVYEIGCRMWPITRKIRTNRTFPP